MGKIVSTAELTFTPELGSAIVVSGLLKFKPPSRKAAEVPATVFGDTARKRLPGKMDSDGCTFSVTAPNASVVSASGKRGSLQIAVVYTDGSKGYWGGLGSLNVEPSESDVEGETIDSLDCSFVSDGDPSAVAVYGPQLSGVNNSVTKSKVALSGSYFANAILSRPATTSCTVSIGGQSITIGAGQTSAVSTKTLSASSADSIYAVLSGTVPANTVLYLVLRK